MHRSVPLEREILHGGFYFPWAPDTQPSFERSTAPPPVDDADMLSPRLLRAPRAPPSIARGPHVLKPASVLVAPVDESVADRALDALRRRQLNAEPPPQNKHSFAATLAELRHMRDETHQVFDYARRIEPLARASGRGFRPGEQSPRYLESKGFYAIPHNPAPEPPCQCAACLMGSPRRAMLPAMEWAHHYKAKPPPPPYPHFKRWKP
eukprot:4678262-Prymnesium_polylepis.1